MAEKPWLPPSPILGAKDMIDDILGPIFPVSGSPHAIKTAGGISITTAGGEEIEVTH